MKIKRNKTVKNKILTHGRAINLICKLLKQLIIAVRCGVKG